MGPGGREGGCRVLATADIVRIKSGAHADYEVMLQEDVLGEVGGGALHDYPRFSASVWNLVARRIAAALSAGEEWPPFSYRREYLCIGVVTSPMYACERFQSRLRRCFCGICVYRLGRSLRGRGAHGLRVRVGL